MGTNLAQDAGRLLLRLVVGGLMLLHGIHKLGHGVAGIGRMFERHGLPEPLAYAVYLGEVVAPLLIVLGVATRMAGLVLAANMAVAILLAHASDLWALSKHGAWAVELQMLFLCGALAISLLGPGRFAVSRRSGWLG